MSSGTTEASCNALLVCDIPDMSVTLTIRLRASEKAQWKRAAAAVRETVAEYVRNAVRDRGQSSPWGKHLGSVNKTVPPATNPNIRRAFAQHRRRRR
jgi:hypothetical protein